jgi:hypothetical protein
MESQMAFIKTIVMDLSAKFGFDYENAMKFLNTKTETISKDEYKVSNSKQTPATTPQILTDIVNYLKQYNINISEAIEGEGRGGSLKDEGSVKKLLWASQFKDNIRDEKARKFGDMTVIDYDKKTEYVVNIKTSIGGTDNCFSKIGVVYALTDIPANKLPKSMNFMTMNKLINEHKADIPGRDYYFLCIDKKDSSNVMVRGAKQIQNWVVNINPGNILQVNWKKEKKVEAVNRTWDEAYEVLIGGVIKSLNGFWNNVPTDWKL